MFGLSSGVKGPTVCGVRSGMSSMFVVGCGALVRTALAYDKRGGCAWLLADSGLLPPPTRRMYKGTLLRPPLGDACGLSSAAISGVADALLPLVVARCCFHSCFCSSLSVEYGCGPSPNGDWRRAVSWWWGCDRFCRLGLINSGCVYKWRHLLAHAAAIY